MNWHMFNEIKISEIFLQPFSYLENCRFLFKKTSTTILHFSLSSIYVFSSFFTSLAIDRYGKTEKNEKRNNEDREKEASANIVLLLLTYGFPSSHFPTLSQLYVISKFFISTSSNWSLHHFLSQFLLFYLSFHRLVYMLNQAASIRRS